MIGLFLDIPMAYGVGPWALHLLQRYWDRLLTVARPGGYFGPPFNDQCGVTQGDPLSLTVVNVMVDTVLRHWVSVVAATEWTAEPSTEGFGQDIQRLEKYFYADNGLLASMQET